MIPEIGKKYPFFDDGKIKFSRLHIAEVTQIVPYKCAERKLRKKWKKEKKTCPWIYAKKTECFVYCSIPQYDPCPIIFVQAADGGWFSIDYPHPWMSGRLDIDGSFFEKLRIEKFFIPTIRMALEEQE